MAGHLVHIVRESCAGVRIGRVLGAKRRDALRKDFLLVVAGYDDVNGLHGAKGTFEQDQAGVSSRDTSRRPSSTATTTPSR
jgi:hypothetical protein